MADWSTIKTEYVTTDITQRDLAEKYGVAPSSVARHSKQEHWIKEREQSESRVRARVQAKTEDKKVDRASRIQSVTDKLMDHVEDLMDNAPDLIDPKSMREIARTIRDIKDIQGIKSDLDRQEQEARIEALRRQYNNGPDDEDETGVVLIPQRLGDDGDA